MNTSHENDSEPPLDYSKILPETRRKTAYARALSFGARLFYALLVDYSVWTGVNMRPGVVRKTNSYWARNFGVCDRTIQNWKVELVDAGLIWLTEKFMKNSMPETVYHLVTIVGPVTVAPNSETEDGSLTEEEDYPASNRRRARMLRDPATGRWAPAGGSETAESPKTAILAQTPDSKGPNGKHLPSPTATRFRSERQPVSVGNGNGFPWRTEARFRGERKPVSVANGNAVPLPTENSFRGARKPVADKEETQVGRVELSKGGKAPPPAEFDEEAAIKKWLPTLDGEFPSKLRKRIPELMEELRLASTDAAKSFVKRKLELVRSRINPKHPDQLKPAPKAPQPAKAKQKQIPLAVAGKLWAKARKQQGI